MTQDTVIPSIRIGLDILVEGFQTTQNTEKEYKKLNNHNVYDLTPLGSQVYGAMERLGITRLEAVASASNVSIATLYRHLRIKEKNQPSPTVAMIKDLMRGLQVTDPADQLEFLSFIFEIGIDEPVIPMSTEEEQVYEEHFLQIAVGQQAVV